MCDPHTNIHICFPLRLIDTYNVRFLFFFVSFHFVSIFQSQYVNTNYDNFLWLTKDLIFWQLLLVVLILIMFCLFPE